MRLPNGYGSIVKLGGKRRCPFAVKITVEWTIDGKQIQKYLGYYKTRTEALKALTDYNEHPYDIDARTATFAELFTKWTKLTYMDRDEKVPNAYTAAYKRLPNLHNMPFTDIRARHIQGEIDACPLGYSTKKMMKTLCNKLFVLAIDCELVTTNYAANAKLPPAEASRIHHPFEPEELALLWQHLDDEGARIAILLSYTGCRPSELLKIRSENVNLTEHYMTGGMKTAAGKNRVIPLSDKILPIVREEIAQGGEYLLLDRRDGRPILTYDRLRGRIWEPSKALKLLPRPHLAHDGRHTCATLLDNACVNLKVSQLILGHSARDITSRVYTHKTIAQLVEAINKI